MTWVASFSAVTYKLQRIIYHVIVLIKKPFLKNTLVFNLNLSSFRSVEVNKHTNIFLNKQFEFATLNIWLIAEDYSKWELKPSYNYPIYYKEKCDIKYSWEINRHQFFPQLGLLSTQQNNEAYIDELQNMFLEWIANNPIGKGINWASSLEISIRIIAWILTISLVKDRVEQSSHSFQKIINSIYQQTHYLAHNLSPTYKPGNNHIIGECCGLVIVTLLFPNFKESKKWREKGLKILCDQLDKQIYADGVCYEQSNSYHRFDLDLLLLLITIARRFRFKLPLLLLNKTEAMLDYVINITQPDGNVPMIGDSDSGRGWKITNNEDFWNFSTCLNLGAFIFHRTDYKYVAPRFSDDAYILLGEEGKEFFDSLKPAYPKITSTIFYDAGIATLRNHWEDGSNYLFFKYGNSDLNYPKLESHAHCDFMSFTLCLKGIPVIVDSGTYTYNGPRKWRDYFRLTSAHNTVKVNGQEQMESVNIFAWKEMAKGQLLDSTLSDEYDMIFAKHDGYDRLANPLSHQRKVEYFKAENRFVISDSFVGMGTYKLEWFFHFHPDLNVKFLSNGKVGLYKDEMLIAVVRIPNGLDDISLNQTWYSESYNFKVKNECLYACLKKMIDNKYEVSFIIDGR